MIELRHMDIRYFVIEESRHPANGCSQMWLHRFDGISLSTMSGCNSIRYKYCRICFGKCLQRL